VKWCWSLPAEGDAAPPLSKRTRATPPAGPAPLGTQTPEAQGSGAGLGENPVALVEGPRGPRSKEACEVAGDGGWGMVSGSTARREAELEVRSGIAAC
jgi:hypothetical protein